MANPRINWKRRILLPFWVIRVCLMLVIIIGFSVAMASSYDDARRTIRYPAAIAFVFFTVLVLLLDAVQIVLWARDRLYPIQFAVLNVFQAAFWGLVFVMDMISIAKEQQSSRAMGLVVVMFLLYLGLFIYALRGYLKQRRLATRGHYTPANDSEPPAVTELRYSESTYDPSDKQYRSPMYQGGDLGESEPLYTTHDGPMERYVDRPMKCTTVV